jgi:hypothetical protein
MQLQPMLSDCFRFISFLIIILKNLLSDPISPPATCFAFSWRARRSGEHRGFLNLAGQTVQASSGIYTFCKAYQRVHVDIDQTRKQVENLKTVLLQVERLILSFFATSPFSPETVSSLERQVFICRKDLEEWSDKIERFGLG